MNKEKYQGLTAELKERCKKELAITKAKFIDMCDREYKHGLGGGMQAPSKFDLGYAEAMRICRNIAHGLVEVEDERN